MQRIDAGRYQVVVGSGSIDSLATLIGGTPVESTSAFAVITDSHVAPLYAERTRAVLRTTGRHTELFVVPAGETSKSRREWSLLSDAMLARGLGRDTTVVALGGGVIGDLAGFVAATYARGIPLVHVPTSLLAMVDASIGGKTAVDTPAGKNLIGAFHWPALVVVDPSHLETLPLRHWREGFAEVLKHGAIASAAHFRHAATLAATLPNAPGEEVTSLVADSIRIKAEIVARDERECGPRRALNAGHTLAHAIERASHFAVSHGEAVSIGLVLEAELGEQLGVTVRGTAAELRTALHGAGLPVTLPAHLTAVDVVAATRSDKKALEGQVQYALLARIGAADDAGGRFSRHVPDTQVRDVLQTFQIA